MKYTREQVEEKLRKLREQYKNARSENDKKILKARGILLKQQLLRYPLL